MRGQDIHPSILSFSSPLCLSPCLSPSPCLLSSSIRQPAQALCSEAHPRLTSHSKSLRGRACPDPYCRSDPRRSIRRNQVVVHEGRAAAGGRSRRHGDGLRKGTCRFDSSGPANSHVRADTNRVRVGFKGNRAGPWCPAWGQSQATVEGPEAMLCIPREGAHAAAGPRGSPKTRLTLNLKSYAEYPQRASARGAVREPEDPVWAGKH